MSALFRVRLPSVTGTRLWFAVSGRLNPRTTHVLRDQLTERCAEASLVVLDLRELDLIASDTALPGPWPQHPHAIHVLASASARARLTADARAHWHTTLDTAWQAWSL